MLAFEVMDAAKLHAFLLLFTLYFRIIQLYRYLLVTYNRQQPPVNIEFDYT